MEIRIFDVSHGFCAMVATNNGGLAFIDCGHDEDGFKPSSFLRAIGKNRINHLVISNFDQDHVSDLHNIRSFAQIDVFHRNRSVSSEYIRLLKLAGGSLTAAMSSAIDLHKDYIHPVPNPPDMGGVEIAAFHNFYPEFTDTNNLSLITFITFDGFTIVFPGDMERAGWLALLGNANFRDYLSKVNIFVASHHGREGGYCAEVFDYCSPDIIVISDKEIVHDTQQHNKYAPHSAGLVWPGNVIRKVVTTRNDGTIRIFKPMGGNYSVMLNQ